MKAFRALVAAATLAGGLALTAPTARASVSGGTPRWIQHIQSYPGGISAGVRAMVSPAAVAPRSKYGGAPRTARAVGPADLWEPAGKESTATGQRRSNLSDAGARQLPTRRPAADWVVDVDIAHFGGIA